MTIHFLHDFRYWTEYLYPHLDPASFSLLRSSRADNSYPAPPLDAANLEHRDLLLAGHSEEKFGAHQRVLAGPAHSPGFGCEAFLHCYRWIHGTSKRMHLPRKVLELLQTTKMLAPNQLVLRDRLLANPRVLATDYDSSLNHLYRAPMAVERVSGTVLVALNWRVTVSNADLQIALAAILKLAKSYSLKLVAHPFSPAQWIGSRHHAALLAACDTANIPVAVGISRSDLMKDLDRSEYIVTDGSGSVYEAVARGCKALLLDGLSYQRGWGIFSAPLHAGLLPSTLAANIDQHPGAEHDLEWLRATHPNSIVDENVSARASDQLFQAFEQWI